MIEKKKQKLEEEKKRKPNEIVLALAKAAFSPESPAYEAFSNMWLLRDVAEIVTAKPQIGHVMFIGGIHGTDFTSYEMTRIFSIESNSWTNGPKLSSDRCNPAGATIVNGELFVVGHDGGLDTFKGGFSLKIPQGEPISPTATWKWTKNLKIVSYSPAIASSGEKIFVLDTSYLLGAWGTLRMHAFSVTENCWSHNLHHHLHSEMSSDRHWPGVIAIKEKIFLIGGYSNSGDGGDHQYLKTADFINTETLVWSKLPSMSHPRYKMAIAQIDDRFIWVLGGFNRVENDLDSIEVFDVEKNEWSEAPVKLPHRMVGSKAVAVDHRIFVFDEYETVEVLDIDKMTWKTAFSSPKETPSRCDFFAVGF